MDTKVSASSTSAAPAADTYAMTRDIPYRKVSWGAIFAGTIVAVATLIALGFLGAGIGFRAVEPGGETDTISKMATSSAIYLVISNLAALFVGGYVAARLSAAWSRQTAIMHGVVVWSLATIAAVWLAVSAAGSILFTSVTMVGSAASAVSSATSAVIPDELPDFKMPQVRMEMLPERVQDALEEQGVTAENLKKETREAFRNVISKQQQGEAREIAIDAAVGIIRSPGDTPREIERAIDDLVGKGGVISDDERKKLLVEMERRLGISEADAEAMIDRWQAEAQSAYQDAKQALDNAREDMIAAGDAATDALGSASIWSFVALLFGLAFAAGGAAAGRCRRSPSAS